MDEPLKQPLGKIMQDALGKELEGGWIYHSTSFPFSASTLCLIISDDDVDYDEDDLPVPAREMGFTTAGLDTSTIEGTAQWCKQFADPPSVDLLVESYNYYWRWDAFLPKPGAPDPPSADETQRQLDLEFFNCLGEERADVPCREPGCARGAVRLSAFCRTHHFENTKKRPCPFEP
jgi:hypothetical protein